MKKIALLFIFLFLLMFVSVSAFATPVLTGSVTAVPESFYGTWRVVSERIEADSDIFKDRNVDLWNLSRVNNVMTLCNMFNGAKAEITVTSADAKHIVFTKTGKYGKKVLSDKVELYLREDKFEGYDTLSLNTYVGGTIVKTESAKYLIKGEKIAGESVTK